MALIFHFIGSWLLDHDGEQTLLGKAVFRFLRILSRSSASFVVVFHDVKDSKTLTAALKERCPEIKDVEVKDVFFNYLVGVEKLKETRKQRSRAIWFLNAVLAKPWEVFDSLLYRFPALPFSFFFRPKGASITSLDQDGRMIQIREFPVMCKMIENFLISIPRDQVCEFLGEIFMDDFLGLDTFVRPLKETDIGEKIMKVKFSLHGMDRSFLYPETFVLKAISSSDPSCSVCKKPTDLVCDKCKLVFYCSVDCQLYGFQHHNKVCQENPSAQKMKTLSMTVERADNHYPSFVSKTYDLEPQHLNGWVVMSEIPGLEDFSSLLDQVAKDLILK